MIPTQRGSNLKTVNTGHRPHRPNQQLRAWMWCVGVVSAFASAVTTVLIVGAIAILNLGTTLGLIIAIVLFCLTVGTGLWYANGKTRL